MTIHRTTIRLDEELVREAKRVALERGTTLTALVEAGLREQLECLELPQKRQAELPEWPGGTLRPGIDLSNNQTIWAALDPMK